MNNVLVCVQVMCQPVLCHRKLLRLGQVLSDLAIHLQNSQRCLFITRNF